VTDDATRSREEGHFERVALGSLLAYPQAIGEVRGWLRPEDFTWPVHRAIYTSALRLNSTGGPVDRTLVLADLRRHQYPDPHENLQAYVLDLDSHVAVPASASYHCRTVLEHSLRRELESVGVRLQQLGERGVGTPDELLDQADAIVAQVQDVRTRWEETSRAPHTKRHVETRTIEVDGQLFGADTR
jgi:replicative DNA helicase